MQPCLGYLSRLCLIPSIANKDSVFRVSFIFKHMARELHCTVLLYCIVLCWIVLCCILLHRADVCQSGKSEGARCPEISLGCCQCISFSCGPNAKHQRVNATLRWTYTMGSVSVLWSRPVAPVAVGSDPEVDWKLHEDYGAELHEDYGAELHEDYGAEERPRQSVVLIRFFCGSN